MSTTTRETTITADPAAPTVRITREFDAPVANVFRAHVEPDLVKRWLGPRGLTMEIDRFDVVTGGSYRYTHRDDDGAYTFYGSFHEVRTDERIVQTFTFEGFPDSVTLETMTFVDLGDGRTRLEGLSLFESTDARDAMIASGMEIGVNEGYEKLDELLAG
ncbi:SRPBCC family protein [Actinomycetospora flava]|uniref:SRPBCC family protein n=1 Tax=Actinomycetospora flava TaxID=3129232 RepID=A0ABU8M7J8_9PSEU